MTRLLCSGVRICCARDEDFNSPTVHRKQIEELYRYEDRATLDVTVTARSGAQSTIRTTPEHPFAIDGAGWVPAGDLAVGMKTIDMDGNLSTISALADAPGLHTVHNFSVTDDHTYFVSDLAVWVHNQSYGMTEAGYIADRQEVLLDKKTGRGIWEYRALGKRLSTLIDDLDPGWMPDEAFETYESGLFVKNERILYDADTIDTLITAVSEIADRSGYDYSNEIPFYESADVRGNQYHIAGKSWKRLSEFGAYHVEANSAWAQQQLDNGVSDAVRGFAGIAPTLALIAGAEQSTVLQVGQVAQAVAGAIPAGRANASRNSLAKMGSLVNLHKMAATRVERVNRQSIEQIGGRDVGPYRSVGSHHPIQDAAVRDIPGYNKRDAISIDLGHGKGSAHSLTYASQRRSGGLASLKWRVFGFSYSSSHI